jgi:hypothetical protein
VLAEGLRIVRIIGCGGGRWCAYIFLTASYLLVLGFDTNYNWQIPRNKLRTSEIHVFRKTFVPMKHKASNVGQPYCVRRNYALHEHLVPLGY